MEGETSGGSIHVYGMSGDVVRVPCPHDGMPVDDVKRIVANAVGCHGASRCVKLTLNGAVARRGIVLPHDQLQYVVVDACMDSIREELEACRNRTSRVCVCVYFMSR